ncbi:MAG: HEPN family nuclease, partial [Cetobacterium sp.]
TLLINCLLGTLILVNNSWIDSLKKIEIEAIKEEYNIIIEREDLVINLGDLIKALRNGICHWNQRNMKKSNGENIKGIIFKEKDNFTIGEICIEGTLKNSHALTINFKDSLELIKFLKLLKENILGKETE